MSKLTLKEKKKIDRIRHIILVILATIAVGAAGIIMFYAYLELFLMGY